MKQLSDQKENFVRHLQTHFPGLNAFQLAPLISENLLSPFVVELPKSALVEAQRSVSALFRLRENPLYQQSYAQELAERKVADPGNKSICMSYDFHVNDQNRLKLIEVNTNASFLALGLEMYRLQNVPLPVPSFSREELRENIETELKLQNKSTKVSKIAIIDENPEQQRLYAEFLVYNEIFQSWGWNSEILDFRNVSPENFDFIYNRHTDFYLDSPESADLRKSFLDHSSCFSPNPYEYCLLADKQRMIDWHQPGALDAWQVSAEDQALIRSVVPQSLDVTEAKKTEIWAKRKGYFFKPKRAFGAKQSYRGSSISNKVFAEILGHEFIAQEFVPPSEVSFQGADAAEPIKMKYDLRCYAYQGRLQLVLARLYQGQVTNLKTPLGGFACVRFV